MSEYQIKMLAIEERKLELEQRKVEAFEDLATAIREHATENKFSVARAIEDVASAIIGRK